MNKFTEEQLKALKEIKLQFELLEQHPFGIFAPHTNGLKRFPISAESYYWDARILVDKCYELKRLLPDIDLFRGNELNSTAHDEVERLNNCKKQTSKTCIQNYMKDATDHLKRDLRNVLEIIEECEDSGII